MGPFWIIKKSNISLFERKCLLCDTKFGNFDLNNNPLKDALVTHKECPPQQRNMPAQKRMHIYNWM